ncbi:hypothetical protein GGG16DRAFT_117736 [Schizophyllum commune]
MLRRRASSEAAPRGARSRTHKSRQSDTRMFISKREDKRLSQPPLLRPLFLRCRLSERRSLDIVRERGTLDEASSGSVDLEIDANDAEVYRFSTLYLPLATFVTIRGPSVARDCAAIIPPYRHAIRLCIRCALPEAGVCGPEAYTSCSRFPRSFHDPRSAYSLTSSYASDPFSTSHARIVKAVPGRVRGDPIDTERSISRTASYASHTSYICIAYEADSDPHEADRDADEATSIPTYSRVGIEDTEGSACYTEDACPSSSIAHGARCSAFTCAEAAAMECEHGGAGVADEGHRGYT